MTRYLTRRLITLLPTLFIVGLVSFLLIHITPGDPVHFILGPDAPAAAVEELRQRLRLNEPLPLQLFGWFTGAVRGDLGESLFSGQPVVTSLLARLEPTLLLTLLSLAVAITIGLALGILAALNRNKWPDQVILVVSLLGLAMPNFWLGLTLILFFAVNLDMFPVAGYASLASGWNQPWKYLILPALALGVSQAAIISRITRTSVLEVIAQDYIRTARAKGVGQRVVVLKHVLRNAFIPILTVIGTIIAVLLGGSVVIEIVFNLPGLGRLMINSVQRRDYPVVQGVLVFITLMNVLVHLIIDVVYAYIDPRIRYT